jgi:hypothetical protein
MGATPCRTMDRPPALALRLRLPHYRVATVEKEITFFREPERRLV